MVDTWLSRILAVACPEEHGLPRGPCWGGGDEHPYFCSSRIQAAEEAARRGDEHDWFPACGIGWVCARCGLLKRVAGNTERGNGFEYRKPRHRTWTRVPSPCPGRPSTPELPKER